VRKPKKNWSGIAIILIFALMLQAGCIGQEEEEPITTTIVTTEPGQTVATTVVKTVEPTTTPAGKPDKLVFTQIGSHFALLKYGNDPATDSLASPLMPFMYETLFEWDPRALMEGNLVIMPWLAESYKVSADGLTWDIKLREGVKFHTTGNEMTADDVKYSYDRYWFYDWTPFTALSPILPLSKLIPDKFESFEVVDKYNFRINLTGLIPDLNQYLAKLYFAVVDSKEVEAHTINLPQFGNVPDWGFTWLNDELGEVGTGPYRMKQFEMTVRYELEYNEDYWGGPPELNLPTPQFKNLLYVPSEEDADARMKLVRGDVHIVADFLADTLVALEENPDVITQMSPSPNMMGLWMHCMNGPLQNWQVRKAIKMALDYDEIIELGAAGGAEVAQGAFMAGMPRWTENARYFTGAQYAEANATLEAAGYPVLEDGFRFHVKMYLRPAPRYGLDFTSLGLVVRDQLRKIGIDVIPIVLHVSEYYAHVFDVEEEMIWVQPGDTTMTPGTPTYLMGSWGKSSNYPWYALNGTTNPEIADELAQIETLYEQSLSEPDDAARLEIYLEIDRLALEYGGHVTIASALYHNAYNANIKGFFWGPKQLPHSIFYLEWT